MGSDKKRGSGLTGILPTQLREVLVRLKLCQGKEEIIVLRPIWLVK